MLSVNLLEETAWAELPQVAKTSQPAPTTPPPATLKNTQNNPTATKPISMERPTDVTQQATAAPSLSSTAQETPGSTAQPAPTRETAASATPAPALRSGVSIDAAYAARNPEPAYPPMARRLGEEGTVTLRILVSADGQATKVEIKRSSGSSLLDKSAQQTIKQWRFIPAKLDGKPVEEWYETSWIFKLEG
jgi:protein TonB